MLRTLLLGLTFLLGAIPAMSAEQMLLRFHGSNTIGAALAPELVKAWLKRQQYREIAQQKTAAEEMLITAVSDEGNKVAVSIKAHGSSTSFEALAAGEGRYRHGLPTD